MKRHRSTAPVASPAMPRPSVPSVRVMLLTLALVAAATLATFSGVLRNDWILTDDPDYVLENPHVNHGLTLEGAAWALHGPHGGNWHPLTSLVHMLNVSLFGLLPAGHHAVSLLLHALNALLVALVCFAYTRTWTRSVLVAAFFALHPQRVESVAWVSELKDVLSAALFLFTLLVYRRWVARPSASRYAAVLAGFALALMAKPMVISLPIVLLILDAWPLRRLGGHVRERVLEKWPLFTLALVDAAITFGVQRQVGAMSALGAHAWGPRLANAAVSVWRYLGKTAWPSGLAIFYPIVPVPAYIAVLAAAGLGAGTTMVLARRRAQPYLAAGWLWFLVMLLPVLGIIQVGGQAYADRYTYLPTFGLWVMVVWGVADGVARQPWLRRATVVVALLWLAALAGATMRQVGRWRDTRTLYEYALTVTPVNPMTECTLGTALMNAGELRPAIARLETAVRMAPEFGYAQNNFGRALLRGGRAAEAIPHLERALPDFENAASHDYLGSAYAAVGRSAAAAREFEAALRMEPGNDQPLFHLGQLFAAQGRYAEAEGLLARVVTRTPDDPERRRQLAMVLLFGGKVDEAMAEYNRILLARPGDLDALTRVAWTRATYPDARFRNAEVALRHAERARATSGAPPVIVESVWAAACAEAGRFAEAELAAERALRAAQLANDTAAEARVTGQLREYRARRALRVEP